MKTSKKSIQKLRPESTPSVKADNLGRINEASVKLSHAMAIADVLAFAKLDELAEHTVQTLALLQWQMIGEAKDLIIEVSP